MRFLLLAAFTFAVISFTGCKSDDGLTGERPWNTPKSWETGLPSQMNEGR